LEALGLIVAAAIWALMCLLGYCLLVDTDNDEEEVIE
jgi:hypothetical protein